MGSARLPPARRSGGSRLHLKVCCLVAAALMCNRTNKGETFGQSQERKSGPDATVPPQNRLLDANKLCFWCGAQMLQLGCSQMLLGLADPDITGVEVWRCWWLFFFQLCFYHDCPHPTPRACSVWGCGGVLSLLFNSLLISSLLRSSLVNRWAHLFIEKIVPLLHTW